jgi:DNA-binding protein Alba
MTTDMENNDSTSSTGEIFLVDSNEPIMNIAFDALEMIRKNKKIVVEGKGEMCSKAVAVFNILTERMLKETAKIGKIDVDSEMLDDGRLISTIKLAIVMTD